MINAIYAWILQDSVREKEIHEAIEKTKNSIVKTFSGQFDTDLDEDDPRGVPETVMRYDEDGRPRPVRVGYDEDYSDGPPPVRARPAPPLPPETAPSDDYENPFPMLDKPLG